MSNMSTSGTVLERGQQKVDDGPGRMIPPNETPMSLCSDKASAAATASDS